MSISNTWISHFLISSSDLARSDWIFVMSFFLTLANKRRLLDLSMSQNLFCSWAWKPCLSASSSSWCSLSLVVFSLFVTIVSSSSSFFLWICFSSVMFIPVIVANIISGLQMSTFSSPPTLWIWSGITLRAFSAVWLRLSTTLPHQIKVHMYVEHTYFPTLEFWCHLAIRKHEAE